MQALIVTGGEAPAFERFFTPDYDFGLVCAADSGLETLRAWGIVPDIIVGDMDSLVEPRLLDEYTEAEILRFPMLKDETDTEIALRIVRERTQDRIVLAGGGGGRLDHLLAIRSLFERKIRPDEWHTASDSLHFVAEGTTIRFAASPGTLVSVFPCARGARGMASVGLQWPISGLAWGPGDCGVSNVCIGDWFSVSAGTGDILVTLARG